MNIGKTLQQWIRWLWLAPVLLMMGCGDKRDPAGEKDGKIRVVTSFTVIADMAREVAGDVAMVESILPPGAEVHGYEPSPQDVVRARAADLVLLNGMNLERRFGKFFSHGEGVAVAVLTEGIEPMGITSGAYSGKPNPHAWMSPANALIYVENIRHSLVKADPKNASVYDQNARSYIDRIIALDQTFRQTFATIPEEKRWLVTSEGAFSYLCRDYGLKQLFLWPVNADAQGTPQQVGQVIDQVRKNRVPVVFSESTISPKPMLQVAAETGARYGGVLYVDSLTPRNGPAPTYLDLLEHNANTILNGFLTTP
ncbi:MAG: hypothetical protein RL346_901 [Verrucomicrobiota bacterium]|jgi:manganese/iron transport system substrate-binding protein